MENSVFRKGLVIGIIILFVGASVIPSVGKNIGNINSNKNLKLVNTRNRDIIYVDDDNTAGPWDGTPEYPYQYIQDGINNANNGDIVLVQDGFYTENIIVDRSISLLGENKDTTVIYGSYSGDVVHITADGVTISHFDVRSGGTNDQDSGIKIFNTTKTLRNCIISDNICQNSYLGIFAWNADNNKIIDNKCKSNRAVGISLYYARYNEILNNKVWDNYYSGIDLDFLCAYNNISGNTLYENHHGLSTIFSSENNIIKNTIFDNSITGIWLADYSRENDVKENSIYSNHNGISVTCVEYDYAKNYIFENEITSNTERGIYIWRNHQNDIFRNNISNNDCGIELLGDCNGNIIYDNIFVNNLNAIDDGQNGWSIEVEPGPNIINGPLISGNYWDDYSGMDINGDGFGDTILPYNCNGNIQVGGDVRPLVDNDFDCRLTGPDNGKVGKELTYFISAITPNEGDVYFYIDWGDGLIEKWFGPYDSDEEVPVSHIWKKKGTYIIMAKAKDIYGYESDLVELKVTMPRNRAMQTPFLNFLQNFLQNHPILYQLLLRFLRL